MRMAAMFALLLILFLPQALQAQKKYKTHGMKCRRMEIVDPGELYSTYEITAEDEETLTQNEGVREDLMQVIIDNCTENAASWPEGMRTLDSRIDNPDVLKKYVAFEVAEFGDRHVLVIPAKYNKGMPAGFAPDEDFFIVIGNKGI